MEDKRMMMSPNFCCCSGMIHVIEKGDTLYSIAKMYGVRLPALMFANPYVDVYNLQIGDELCIPRMRPMPREGEAAGENRMPPVID